MSVRIALLIALLVLVVRHTAGSLPADDVVIRLKSTTHDRLVENVTDYIGRERVRGDAITDYPNTRHGEGQRRTSGGAIFDIPARVIYTMNHDQKTYKERKALSPGKPREAEFRWKATGERRVISGIRCEVFRVYRGNWHCYDDCIAPWGEEALSKEDQAVLVRLYETMGASDVDREVPIATYPGYLIHRDRYTRQGEHYAEEVVLSIKRGPLPPEIFKVPPDYAREDGPRDGAKFGCGCRLGGR